MSDEQRLNSLDRFRKRPGRLVLEVYSHCEVPAGCGGAVLRWRDPRAAVPVLFRVYSAVKATCFLDGAELRTAGTDLTPGRHVVAVALERVGAATALLMFAAVSDDRAPERALPTDLTGRRLMVHSRADGTWKYALERPASDDWKAAAIDDSRWPALVGVPTPQLSYSDPGGFECHRAAEAGAQCLGLPAAVLAAGGVWVRKVFDVPAPQGR
jgi:hypothetical protein